MARVQWRDCGRTAKAGDNGGVGSACARRGGSQRSKGFGIFGRPARGLTLVELLVVISILMLLAAFAIPTVRPAMESRRVRETARAVNAYISQTRVRAMETGTPYGVELTRWDRQAEASVMLRQIVVPPPYTGRNADAVVRVQQWGSTRVFKVLVRGGDPVNEPGKDDFDDTLIREGDLMQFGSCRWSPGALTYMIMDVNAAWGLNPDLPDFPPTPRDGQFINFHPSNRQAGYRDPAGDPWVTNYVLTVVLVSRAAQTPWPSATQSAPDVDPNTKDLRNWSRAVPFCILRQPVPSETQPLRLTEQMCIDLCESGTDNATFEPINRFMPVWILFAPDGALHSVLGVYDPATGANLVSPADRIYLLVGRQDRLPANAVFPTVANQVATTGPRGNPDHEDGLRNWQDTASLWITINPISGLVTTIENASCNTAAAPSWLVPPPPFDYNARDGQNRPTHRLWALGQARSLAKQAQSMGGR